MPFTPTVLIFKGSGCVDLAIRWQTRSVYTHAAIRTGPSSVLESYPGVGVRERILSGDDFTAFDSFTVAGMSAAQWEVALAFFRHELGCGYDWINVWRFVSRLRGRQSSSRWFCSEIVFASVAAAGVRLLEREDAWRISPRDLSLSTMLIPQDGLQTAMERARNYVPGTKKI